MLCDSYNKNTGDKAMGIVMADFCLKLYRAGLRNVYLPQVTLYHPEFRKDIASARIGVERS